MMVAKLWERVIKEVSQLPEKEQEEIAEIVLSRISEKQSSPEPSLSIHEMLEQARRDHREGRTRELDPDEL